MTDHREKLVHEQALKSLRDEMRIQGLLDRAAWVSVHSHHFFDLRENKWRELDAVASRSWLGALAELPVRVKMMFIVESKSLAGKHVLLPAFHPLRQALVFDWIGSGHRQKQRHALCEQAGFDTKLIKRLDSTVYPAAADVMPGTPHILLPPKDPDWHAAGFTEARNSESSKDKHKDELGSSVIWKARLALQSAAQALVQTEMDTSAREFQLALQFARLRRMTGKAADESSLIDGIVEDLKRWPPTITVFHPMVVVDSDLWGVSLDKLVPIHHARVHLTGVSRYPYFWFDLVSRNALDQVIEKAQAGYDEQALNNELEPDEPAMGVVEYEIAHP